MPMIRKAMKTIPMIGRSEATESCAVRWLSMETKITTCSPADKIKQFACSGEYNSTMKRQELNDLLAFLAVARDRSFTKAAAKLGVSRSALSHTMRGLEARIGLQLLTRTTRSVSPTAAGERLLQSVGHRVDEIEVELEALSELRNKSAGT